MIDFTNLYTNYASTGHLEKADANAAKIVSLVNELKKERNKNSPKIPKTPGAPGDGRRGLKIWKFENDGKFNNVGGVKHVVCTYYSPKYDKGNGGIYVFFLYNRPKWISSK